MSPAERGQLAQWVRTRTSPHRLVVRSRIVLLAADGMSVRQVAQRVHVTPSTVRLWCRRFHRFGVAALVRDAPGRGRPRGMSRAAIQSVLRAMLSQSARSKPWSARSLAAAAATSPSTVWRVWKQFYLHGRSSLAAVQHALERVISETPDAPK